MNPDDLSLIDSIAAEQMGVPPTQQAAPQPPAEPKETEQEKATQNVAPKAEDNKSKQPAAEFFELDMGDGQRQAYTPEQLSGIVRRYSDLNYRHQSEVAPVKKTLSFLNQIMSEAKASGAELDDDGMASLIENALMAYTKNPQLGAQRSPLHAELEREDQPVQKPGQVDPNSIEDQLAQWESQNAVTLPPMYKDAITKTSNLESTVAELRSQLDQLLKTNVAQTKTVEEQSKAVQQDRSEVVKQKVVNNLQRVQMQHQLPDEAEQDFMAFVQGRGYDVWELMDYDLANTLAQDFKNNMQAPELDRFREMAKRRQSFTGIVSSGPQGGGAAGSPQPSADDSFISSMTDEIMKKKNML